MIITVHCFTASSTKFCLRTPSPQDVILCHIFLRASYKAISQLDSATSRTVVKSWFNYLGISRHPLRGTYALLPVQCVMGYFLMHYIGWTRNFTYSHLLVGAMICHSPIEPSWHAWVQLHLHILLLHNAFCESTIERYLYVRPSIGNVSKINYRSGWNWTWKEMFFGCQIWMCRCIAGFVYPKFRSLPFEKAGNINPAAQRYIPEDWNPK